LAWYPCCEATRVFKMARMRSNRPPAADSPVGVNRIGV